MTSDPAAAGMPIPAPLADPRGLYPKPPFEEQFQRWPGLAANMTPIPDHGEASYCGRNRLAGRKALKEFDWSHHRVVRPVRSVEPQLMFELAFEGIACSRRHQSGVAVRFPAPRQADPGGQHARDSGGSVARSSHCGRPNLIKS